MLVKVSIKNSEDKDKAKQKFSGLWYITVCTPIIVDQLLFFSDIVHAAMEECIARIAQQRAAIGKGEINEEKRKNS